MQILGEAKHRARKYHHCDHCGRMIPPGEEYHRAFLKDGGDTWSWVSHLDCLDMASVIHRAIDLNSDEGICLHEEWACYPDETAEWRGLFPHVICRLELNAQLAGARRPYLVVARPSDTEGR